jgi:hypothetical protein
MYAPQMAGSQKLDEFVNKHFSRTGERHKQMNRWKMKCHYCTLDTILEHCELRCMEHLSKYNQCPNTPEDIRKEELQQLATKHSLLPSTPINKLGTISNPHTVRGDNNNNNNDNNGNGNRVACKKRKGLDGSTKKQKWGAMDAFVDCGFSDEEKAQVDLILLRYVCSAATCVNGVMTYLQSDHFLQYSTVDTRGSIFN